MWAFSGDLVIYFASSLKYVTSCIMKWKDLLLGSAFLILTKRLLKSQPWELCPRSSVREKEWHRTAASEWSLLIASKHCLLSLFFSYFSHTGEKEIVWNVTFMLRKTPETYAATIKGREIIRGYWDSLFSFVQDRCTENSAVLDLWFILFH